LQFLPYQAISYGLIALAEHQSVIRSNEEQVRHIDERFFSCHDVFAVPSNEEQVRQNVF